MEEDRTAPGEELNHAAVEDFLRCRGAYTSEGEYSVSSDEDAGMPTKPGSPN